MLLDVVGRCWMLSDVVGCCWMLLDVVGQSGIVVPPDRMLPAPVVVNGTCHHDDQLYVHMYDSSMVGGCRVPCGTT